MSKKSRKSANKPKVSNSLQYVHVRWLPKMLVIRKNLINIFKPVHLWPKCLSVTRMIRKLTRNRIRNRVKLKSNQKHKRNNLKLIKRNNLKLINTNYRRNLSKILNLTQLKKLFKRNLIIRNLFKTNLKLKTNQKIRNLKLKTNQKIRNLMKVKNMMIKKSL